MWKKTLLWCWMLALLACRSVPVSDNLKPSVPQAVDEHAAQREYALAKVIVKNEYDDSYEFTGQTKHVKLSDFSFEPAELHFKSGTVTRMRINNIGKVTHYFGGNEFLQHGAEIVDVNGKRVLNQHHIPVSPYSSRDIYLFIKAPGEYPLSCFVPIHVKMGMTGTLIVEP